MNSHFLRGRASSMFGIGLSEIIVIGIVGLLLFGGKLPEMAFSLGKFIRRLQRGLEDIKSDIEDQMKK